MFKKLLKLIPSAMLLNKFLLNKRIQNQFLSLLDTEQTQLGFNSHFIKKRETCIRC